VGVQLLAAWRAEAKAPLSERWPEQPRERWEQRLAIETFNFPQNLPSAFGCDSRSH